MVDIESVPSKQTRCDMRASALLAGCVLLACTICAHADPVIDCKQAADANDLELTLLRCHQANEVKILPENYVNIGHVKYGRRLYTEAEFYFIQAVNLNPKLAVAHFNLGRVKEVLGKTDEAFEQYQQALLLGDPDARQAISEIVSKNALADAAQKTEDRR
jgi:tetratricopeptide (TPR) repeat protein